LGGKGGDGRNGAERLLAHDAHRIGDTREERRCEEMAAVTLAWPTAPHDRSRPGLQRVAHVSVDLVDRRGIDQWPDLHAVGQAVAQLEGSDEWSERLEKWLDDRRVHIE